LIGETALAEELLGLQRALFVVGADLATNPKERDRLEPGVSLVTSDMVETLERRIDSLVVDRPLPNAFVVPGDDPVSAAPWSVGPNDGPSSSATPGPRSARRSSPSSTGSPTCCS
jgi:hypothetical protein